MHKNTHNQEGFAHLAIVAVLAVALVVGFAGYRVYSNNENTVLTSENTNEAIDEIDEIPTDLEGVLAVDEIRELSLVELPDGEIVSVELELEHGTLVYKVTFADGTVKMYNAKTGEVYVDDHEDGEDSDHDSDDESKPNGETFNTNHKVGLTVANAIAIAREQFPGSRVKKVEVEVEDGVVVFSVRFTDSGRVDVNSTTGKIVRTEKPESEKDEGSSSGSDDSEDHEEDESDDD